MSKIYSAELRSVAPYMAQPPMDERRKKEERVVRDPLSKCVEAVNEFHRKAKVAEEQAYEIISAAVENAFQAGLALIELKSLVKHGDWAKTIETKCPGISQRTAARYMKLANEYRDCPDQLPQKPLRELYLSSDSKARPRPATKQQAESRLERGSSGGFSREFERLKRILKEDNRRSFVAEMSPSDRLEFTRLLRELIKLLNENPA